MKKFLKKIAGGLLCLAIMAGLSPSADAYYYCKQTIIADPQSPHIEKIMEDIDRQRFESEEQREQVKEAVSYLLFDSGFSAINQGAFPYYNYNSYAEKVSDGNYTFTVWAAGCYAYAKWASQLCYGDGMSGTKLYIKNENGGDIKSVWNLTPEGVKDFLRNNCQAGEHMRIDYVHSLCFLACSDEGVYFADYAGDAKPYIRLCFASYDAFFNAIRTGSSFWLSDVVSIENEGELEEDVMPEPEPEPEPEITKISLCINDPLITVNGETYPIDALGTTPLIRNDRTLLPIRAVVEALGGYVEWDHATRTVSLHKDGKILYLRIDQNYMWDGEGNIPIDTAPTIIGDRTMVPLRAPLEYFGATVHWDHEARMATITYIQQLEK